MSTRQSSCTRSELPRGPVSAPARAARPGRLADALQQAVEPSIAPQPVERRQRGERGDPERPPIDRPLGRFSGVGSTCITDQVAPDPDPPFTPAGPAPYATATFTNPRWTLTAANGDELWLENDAVAVLSLADMSLEAHGTQRIVGGTGRFAGATGEAAITGVNEDGQGPDDFGGYGWIRFD